MSSPTRFSRLRKSRLAVAAAALVIAVPATAYAATSFTDVPPGAFYADAVDWAAANGITTGTTATTFEPDATVTRGQNVTFAKRYHDNVAQPALDAINAALSQDFSISHHTSSLVDDGVGTELDLDRFTNVLAAEGDGYLQLPLAVPSQINGASYALTSVEFCLSSSAGSVNSVEVWADDAQVSIDNTDRSGTGCWELAAATSGAELIFSFNLQDDGPVSIDSVTSNWSAS